jgi:hypothetical protein
MHRTPNCIVYSCCRSQAIDAFWRSRDVRLEPSFTSPVVIQNESANRVAYRVQRQDMSRRRVCGNKEGKVSLIAPCGLTTSRQPSLGSATRCLPAEPSYLVSSEPSRQTSLFTTVMDCPHETSWHSSFRACAVNPRRCKSVCWKRRLSASRTSTWDCYTPARPGSPFSLDFVLVLWNSTTSTVSEQKSRSQESSDGGGPENDPRDTDSRARHKHAKHLDQTIATPAKHDFLRLTIWPLRFGKGYRIPTWRGTAIHCLFDNVG